MSECALSFEKLLDIMCVCVFFSFYLFLFSIFVSSMPARAPLNPLNRTPVKSA